MKCNVGGMDRALRILIGVMIILFGIFFESWWGLIGLLPLLTGIFRFCPAYMPFGVSTCKTEEEP